MGKSLVACGLLSALILMADKAGGQSALLFVSEKTATRAGGLVPLDRFSDEEMIHAVPGPSVVARKFFSIGFLNTMLGDEDFDDNFLESDVVDEIDALALSPSFSGADPTLYDLVFSTQNDFGEAYGPAIDDGSLWRFDRPPTAGGFTSPVEIFLPTSVLQAGLATTSGLDIDALAFAADGSLLLSFREDELIQGDAVLVGDGGIVGFPAASVVYAPDGDISTLGNNTAHIVLTESAVDSLVAGSGLLDFFSAPIVVINDLQGLAIDPSGGTFLGSDGSSWPHLLFCGSTTGPRILTTQGGIGSLNGVDLGDLLSPDASVFGLDGVTDEADFTSLAVLPDADVPLVVDWTTTGFSPSFLSDTLYLGNASPSAPLLAVFSIESTTAGNSFASFAFNHYRFPALYTLPVYLLLPLGSADASGRALLPVQFPPGITFDVNLVLQVIDNSGPELSAPTILTYDAEGA